MFKEKVGSNDVGDYVGSNITDFSVTATSNHGDGDMVHTRYVESSKGYGIWVHNVSYSGGSLDLSGYPFCSIILTK